MIALVASTAAFASAVLVCVKFAPLAIRTIRFRDGDTARDLFMVGGALAWGFILAVSGTRLLRQIVDDPRWVDGHWTSIAFDVLLLTTSAVSLVVFRYMRESP